MPDVFSALHKTRRKGIGIIETIILMVVLGITFGAVFTTLEWAQRSHAFSRHDRESRELLFSWVQNFEAVWPSLEPDVGNAIRIVSAMMGGSVPTVSGVTHTAQLGLFTVAAQDMGQSNGARELRIVISGGRNAPWVELNRRFNMFSSETVSDDVVI